MDALLMCGGPGSRLEAPVEKPLLPVGGRPMIDRVADALAGSDAGTTHAVVSPHAPDTRDHVRDDLGLPTIETPGDGYVSDLDVATDRLGPDDPVLTVAADLPLLTGGVVDGVLEAHARGSRGSSPGAPTAVYVPTSLKRQLGVSVDETRTVGGRELSPAGINVVAPGGDRVQVSNDVRVAVNVNRPGDADVAEALL